MKSQKGFTLIELLVVTAILGVVTAVIGACLLGGIRAWDSVRKFNAVEARAIIGLEIMEKDLMNSFPFYGIGFNGGQMKVSFPGVIGNPPLTPPGRGTPVTIPSSEGWPKAGVGAQIGTIKYFFDERHNALFRKEWFYPADELSRKHSEKIISNLSDVSLQYYFLPDEKDAAGSWRGDWNNETNFPGGVRIELSFLDNSETFKIERTVLLPVSGGPH